IDHIGGESFGGCLEGNPGAGGVLEEQVHHRATAQRGQLLDLPGLGGCHRGGGVQDLDGLIAAQVGRGQQVLHDSTTASWPSSSASCTLTRSVCEVGRFLPMKSARIGSSRWPRSTSTASCTARGRPISDTASNAARTVLPE